jgi:hypothetical protein
MKKVVNVEPGDVFTLLAAGKDVYSIDMLEENVINMRYQPVYSIFDTIKAGERAFFIIEEEVEP